MIVGLTGGIASGKTTVLQIFANLGVPTSSADEISKEILKNDKDIHAAIIAKFGNEFLNEDLSINRAKIRQKIFDSATDRLWLEQLLHPQIKQRILKFGEHCQALYCVVEIPLLLEVQWLDCVDAVLIVDCPPELQIQRASERDKTTEQEIQKVIRSQLTREERLASNFDIIDNSGDIVALEQRVVQLHQQYLATTSKKS